MDPAVSVALDKLNALLPLARHQSALAAPLRALHRAVLRSFATTGLPLSPDRIAARADIRDAAAAVQELARLDLLVLDSSGQKITGAYPFTTEPRMHRVSLQDVQVQAMCALDALAVAPLCHATTHIVSRCAVSDVEITIDMQGMTVLQADPPAPWVGIHWQGTGGCAAQSLCLEMVFLQDRTTAHFWKDRDPAHIDVFDLPAATEFAAAFFTPLLD